MRDDLLLIKGHWFLFFAALGPILPFLSVIAKQHGVSETAMGLIYTILPAFYFPSKALFGFIMDTFLNKRRLIFTLLVCFMGISYLTIYFVPPIPMQKSLPTVNETCLTSWFCDLHPNDTAWEVHQKCNLNCENGVQEYNVEIYLKKDFCKEHSHYNHNNFTQEIANSTYATNSPYCNISKSACNVTCDYMNDKSLASLENLWRNNGFWIFVTLLTCGLISFNIINCISDTITMNALGDGNEHKYGKLRLWGSASYGIIAFVAGYYIDHISKGSSSKNDTPAFVFFMFFISIDIILCSRLKFAPITTPRHIPKETWKIVRKPSVATFLLFTMILGSLDGFAVCYLLLYLENIAIASGFYDSIRLIEGLLILLQSLGGEIFVFMLSGISFIAYSPIKHKLFNKLGYETTFSLCFLFYTLRFIILSFIFNPWLALPFEMLFHGLTYALAYSSIVAYASAISTVAIRGTIQGISTGIHDGIGYALAGGIGAIFTYLLVPLRIIFRMLGFYSLVMGFIYYCLYILLFKQKTTRTVNRDLVYVVPENQSRSTVTTPLTEQ